MYFDDKPKNHKEEGEIKMIHRFPKDCWGKKCPHFKVWDLSIDDLCCHCDLLKVSCDACDEDFSFITCPLKQQNDCKEETE